MTTIRSTKKYRGNGVTMIVENYSNPPFIASLWRVLYKFDGFGMAHLYKDDLMSQPSAKQIRKYLQSF